MFLEGVSVKVNGIGDFKTINSYVKNKISEFSNSGKTFEALFEFMFSEKNNIMYEYSKGYRIIKKTYGEVYDEILHLSSGLYESLKGIESGSTIGIYMDNSLSWIEIFWAVIICGYNPLLLNLRVADEVIEDVLKTCNTKLIISDGKKFTVNTLLFSEIIPKDNIDLKVNYGTEVLVISSGTTDSIKICAYTAEEFYYQICGSFDIIKKCPAMKTHYDGNIKQLTFLPFYHVFGLIAVYIWFAFFQRSFVALNDMSPQTLLNTVKRHKVTHIFAVPLFWETVYKKALDTIKSRGDKVYSKFKKGLDLSLKLHNIPIIGKLFKKIAFKEVRDGLFGDSIQFMITGGSAISDEALSFFNGIGYHLANGYGMTEIGITSVELSDSKKYLLGSYVGEPMQFCEYKIDSKGELYVKGKCTAKYIIENNVKKDNDDWYCTHDLAEYINGHYKIISRIDDVIVSSNGENINPYYIEPNFRIPNVLDVCLIKSYQNSKYIPTLLIQIDRLIGKENFVSLSDSVNEIAKNTSFPLDGKIYYTTTPLISGGEFKLNRLRISKDFSNGKFVLTNPESLQLSGKIDDEIINNIRAILARQIDKDEESIGIDDDFFINICITSLEYFALIAEINNEYSINIMPDSDKNLRTVHQVADKIKECKLIAV